MLSLLAKITAIDVFPPSDLLLSEPFFTHQQNKFLDHNSHHNSLLLTAPQWLLKLRGQWKSSLKWGKDFPGSGPTSFWAWFLGPLPSRHTHVTLFQSLHCVTLSCIFLCGMSSVGPHPYNILVWSILNYTSIHCSHITSSSENLPLTQKQIWISNSSPNGSLLLFPTLTFFSWDSSQLITYVKSDIPAGIMSVIFTFIPTSSRYN